MNKTNNLKKKLQILFVSPKTKPNGLCWGKGAFLGEQGFLLFTSAPCHIWGLGFGGKRKASLLARSMGVDLLHQNDKTAQQLLHKIAPPYPSSQKIICKIITTPFQRRVYRLLWSLDRTKPISYGALSHKLETAPRAVGNACKANRLCWIIPCHLVISKNNTIGGYRFGVRIKKHLLAKEGIKIEARKNQN